MQWPESLAAPFSSVRLRSAPFGSARLRSAPLSSVRFHQLRSAPSAYHRSNSAPAARRRCPVYPPTEPSYKGAPQPTPAPHQTAPNGTRRHQRRRHGLFTAPTETMNRRAERRRRMSAAANRPRQRSSPQFFFTLHFILHCHFRAFLSRMQLCKMRRKKSVCSRHRWQKYTDCCGTRKLGNSLFYGGDRKK